MFVSSLDPEASEFCGSFDPIGCNKMIISKRQIFNTFIDENLA